MKYLKRIESIDNKELIIIGIDGWEGIYCNNNLIDQGHSINWKTVLDTLGYKIKDRYYLEAEEWTELIGDGANLPDNLEELRIKLDSKKFNL